jgi:hypothetical protein
LHNLVIINNGAGIKVEEDAEKNEIFYNFVLGNETYDPKDDNLNCDSKWRYKNFAKRGNPPCTLEW